jgi:folate-binding Fe-S cluster repair protein YgfZ
VPVAEKDEILSNIEAAGAVRADEDSFRIVRLEHGRPRYGEDISERYLAQEANQPTRCTSIKGATSGRRSLNGSDRAG